MKIFGEFIKKYPVRIFRFEKHPFELKVHHAQDVCLRPVNSQKTISFNPVTFPPGPRLDVYNI